jgi:hypothetical protein
MTRMETTTLWARKRRRRRICGIRSGHWCRRWRHFADRQAAGAAAAWRAGRCRFSPTALRVHGMAAEESVGFLLRQTRNAATLRALCRSSWACELWLAGVRGGDSCGGGRDGGGALRGYAGCRRHPFAEVIGALVVEAGCDPRIRLSWCCSPISRPQGGDGGESGIFGYTYARRRAVGWEWLLLLS